MIKAMLMAGCGGFVGTCCRYLVVRLCAENYNGQFPLGTFIVNIVGCLVAGVIFGLLERTQILSPAANVPLIIGFCGGFTTFSSMANDMWVLGAKGDWITTALYLSLSVVLGVAMIFLGRIIVDRV